MKKSTILGVILLSLLLTACHSASRHETAFLAETTFPQETVVFTESEPVATTAETTSPPVPVLTLTEEEKTILLKLAMAERGDTRCKECMALVMRTVINRVESGRFGKSIRSVVYAQGQFTPIADGTFDSAQPSTRCQAALDMVIYGWDESHGALFYEWCEGESWHSKNLHLLHQHCDMRLYD